MGRWPLPKVSNEQSWNWRLIKHSHEKSLSDRHVEACLWPKLLTDDVFNIFLMLYQNATIFYKFVFNIKIKIMYRRTVVRIPSEHSKQHSQIPCYQYCNVTQKFINKKSIHNPCMGIWSASHGMLRLAVHYSTWASQQPLNLVTTVVKIFINWWVEPLNIARHAVAI
jgi:hypothetical protein